MSLREIKGLEEFKENVKENTLVMFHADWCGPCQMTKPGVKELSEEGFDVVMVNVDDNRDVAIEYGVSSIPAIKIFRDKKLYKDFVGFTPKETIKEALNS